LLTSGGYGWLQINLAKEIHCVNITAGMRGTRPVSIRDISFNINNFIPSLTKLVADSPV